MKHSRFAPPSTCSLLFASLISALVNHCGPASDSPIPEPSQPDSDPLAEVLDAGADPDAAVSQPDASPVSSCSATDHRSVPLTVYVEPDADEAPFVDALATAQTSIQVMVYMMGYGGILDTLKSKAQQGVKVKVILDQYKQDTNQKYFTALTQAGAEVIWSDPSFTYMHAKVIIVDQTTAIVSTGNYSASNIRKERNFVVRDADPADVASLVSLFDADWQRQQPSISCTRMVVSPINAKARILALIQSAKTSLVIESMQLADKDVRAAIAERHAAGVYTRVILADPSWIDANADAAAFLDANQIGARYMSSPGVHVKAIVVDNTWMYVGSENLSYTSLTKNREVGVIDGDPEAVKPVSDTFEKDWAVATVF